MRYLLLLLLLLAHRSLLKMMLLSSTNNRRFLGKDLLQQMQELGRARSIPHVGPVP
jgi:hypothetical protein